MARGSPSKTAAAASDVVDAALDELYGAPFDGFVETRRELAAGLRSGGDVASSRVVAAASKPTRSAWAINQVVRRNPERIRDVMAAWDEAAAAQGEGDAAGVRARAREFRARIADVTQLARSILEQSGSSLSALQARRLGETLQAAAGGGDALRARLSTGRLVEDIEAQEPFAGIVAPADPRPARGLGASKPNDDDARQRRAEQERRARARAVDAARARVDVLDGEVKAARERAREAEIVALRAQGDAERARRAVVDAESRLASARAELEKLDR